MVQREASPALGQQFSGAPGLRMCRLTLHLSESGEFVSVRAGKSRGVGEPQEATSKVAVRHNKVADPLAIRTAFRTISPKASSQCISFMAPVKSAPPMTQGTAI